MNRATEWVSVMFPLASFIRGNCQIATMLGFIIDSGVVIHVERLELTIIDDTNPLTPALQKGLVAPT